MNFDTGCEAVDIFGGARFSGDMVCPSWYNHVLGSTGRPHMLAIAILSDIVYWYRPREVRDEQLNVIRYTKKFKADILQRSYDQICNKFNCSRKMAREALVVLENLGLIKRIFRTVNINGVNVGNIMYIDIDAKKILEISYPCDYRDEDGNFPEVIEGYEEQKDTQIEATVKMAEGVESYKSSKMLTPERERGFIQKDTYTKTTTKINNICLTTTINTKNIPRKDSVVVEARKIFSEFNFSDANIKSILSAAEYKIEKCKQAINVFRVQTTPIKNLVGWFISAIRNGYELSKAVVVGAKPKVQAKKPRSAYHNFSQRDYDFAALEQALLSRPSMA